MRKRLLLGLAVSALAAGVAAPASAKHAVRCRPELDVLCTVYYTVAPHCEPLLHC